MIYEVICSVEPNSRLGIWGTDLSVRPPNCVTVVASWNVLYHILERLKEDRQAAPALAVHIPGSKVEIRGVSDVDGHAHLEIL